VPVRRTGAYHHKKPCEIVFQALWLAHPSLRCLNHGSRLR